MSIYIAMDIGGTHTRVASFSTTNISPIQVSRISTQALDEPTLSRLAKLIEEIWPKTEIVKAIGIAAPGPSNPYTGVVYSAPNIPSWKNLQLREYMEGIFNVPVAIGNDANLAGLAEWKYGAGKGHRDVLYLTVSTGIGGGVILDNHLIQGQQGLATELGHIVIAENGPLCSCGFRGHLEAFSSGTGIENFVAENLARGHKSILAGKPSAKIIAEAAIRGDNLASKAYKRAGKYLGIGVANYLHIFNPSIVIFGGGVSMSGELLFKPFQISLQKHVFHPRYLEGLVITQAQLGDDAGLLGARALAEMKIGI